MNKSNLNLKTKKIWYKPLTNFHNKKERPTNFELLEIYQQFKNDLGFYISYLIDEPVIVAPAVLQLNLIFRCNYNCTMCSISGKASENIYPRFLEKSKEMPIEIVLDLIKQAQKMGVKEVLILGGEPLLYSDVFKVIKYSLELGMEPTLITNAALVTKKVAKKLIDVGLPSFRASLDGATSKTHNNIRGVKDAYEKSIKGIKNMVEAKAKAKTNHPHIGITCTIMNQNAHDVYNVLKKAIELNLDGINFQPVIVSNTNPFNYDKKDSILWPTKKRVKKICNQIDKIIEFKKGKIKLLKNNKDPFYFLENPFGHLNAIKDYFNQKLKSVCYAGYNRLQITQYGNLYLCSDTFGNVYEGDKLKDLFFSNRAKKARKKIKTCKTHCGQWCSFDIKSRYYVDSIDHLFKYINKLNNASKSYQKSEYVEIYQNMNLLIEDSIKLLKYKLSQLKNKNPEIKKINTTISDLTNLNKYFKQYKDKEKKNILKIYFKKIINSIK